MTKLNFAK
jgi:hypothetical protein